MNKAIASQAEESKDTRNNRRRIKARYQRQPEYRGLVLAWLYGVLKVVKYVMGHRIGPPIRAVPYAPTFRSGANSAPQRKVKESPVVEARTPLASSSAARKPDRLQEVEVDWEGDMRCVNCSAWTLKIPLGLFCCSKCGHRCIAVAY
jgi:hypothetical protein